jgi:hypothetical protein
LNSKDFEMPRLAHIKSHEEDLTNDFILMNFLADKECENTYRKTNPKPFLEHKKKLTKCLL